MVVPSGQSTGSPAAQVSKPQLDADFEQSSRQEAPSKQWMWQLTSVHSNTQLEPFPHVQSPFAHSPPHEGLLPSHSTWQGPALQRKSQRAPIAQLQVPFAHTPAHSDLGPQAT